MSEIEVSVRYFGGLRQLISVTGREKLRLASGCRVDEAVDTLCERHPLLGRVRAQVRVAVNAEFASLDTPLDEGDTLALIPPVAGGQEVARVEAVSLTEQPLRLDELVQAVSGPTHGGLCIFIGTVRNHNDGKQVVRLEYEAYSEMVRSQLTGIVGRCEAIADGVRVAVAHRIGELEVGDAAVIVAASAPHRPEAFEASRMCIELLKQDVPIWKRELSPDGDEWIGLRP
jgi:MoaE-MoaD fusion protein